MTQGWFGMGGISGGGYANAGGITGGMYAGDYDMGGDDDDVGAYLAGAAVAPIRVPAHPAAMVHPAMVQQAHLVHPAMVHPHLGKKWARFAMAHGWTPPHHEVAPHGYNPQVLKYEPFQGGEARGQSLGVNVFCPALSPTQDADNIAQYPMRVDGLTIPSTLAPYFVVNDFKVGNIAQFNASGPQSAVVYSEQSLRITLRGDTAYMGQTLTVNVTNISGVDKHFYATIWGPAVR
jgi:hypothetical protein